MVTSAEPLPQPLSSLTELPDALNGCRRCDRWRLATQGVPGEGPAHARIMLVGEVPGDSEDLAGRPFVGPSGALLDRALDQAGIERRAAYVTGAVKHFKFEQRGKRRLHVKPTIAEIKACHFWLDEELRLVRPRLVIALGATAGRAVLQRPVTIGALRGQPLLLPKQVAWPERAYAWITVHPSYVLRLPDEAERLAEFARLVADLKAANEWLGSDARPARVSAGGVPRA
jgi:uracil-DNA glycosylase